MPSEKDSQAVLQRIREIFHSHPESYVCDYCDAELSEWEYTPVGYVQLPECPECGKVQVGEMGWTPKEAREIHE